MKMFRHHTRDFTVFQDQIQALIIERLAAIASLTTENDTLKEEATKDIRGIVKWFNVKNGFGFITRNDTKEDIFVHQSNIILKNNYHKEPSLGDGEKVDFDVCKCEKGFEAVNVRGPKGQPVLGSEHATTKNSVTNKAKSNPQPSPPSLSSQMNVSITTGDIIERLKTIASLITKLKIAYYDKKLLPTWNGIYQKLKMSSAGLRQDVKENSCADLATMHIFGCLDIIEIHTAELKRRTRGGGRCHRRKKKISDQLLNSKSFSLKSFNSICKSIIENINTTIQELRKIESIVIDSMADHFNVSLDLESSSDSLAVARDDQKFLEDFNELVPIDCFNENQVLEL